MITQARLKELLDYNPETGVFVWKVRRGGIANAGSVAGGVDGKGYVRINVDFLTYKAHRLAWFYVTGKWPRDQIDHTNCTKNDNRFSNLREASNSENKRNTPRYANNTSGTKGDYRIAKTGRWRAIIRVDRVRIHLGVFGTVEEAITAYAEGSARLHRDFGRVA